MLNLKTEVMFYETNCTEITQDKPRFKSRRDRQSFLCPQHCRVDFEKGTLTIPKAKDISAVPHRKFKGMVKTVTISMTPSGKYFASVLVLSLIHI